MARASLFFLFAAVAVSTVAVASEEGQVHREEVDAGVHVPVLTKPPALTEFIEAAYPPEAQQQSLTGDVRLRITIAADGSVADAEAIEGSGHGFDEAALEAVRRFKFTPAEVDGAPAPIQIEYVYHFTLNAPDAGVGTGTDAGVELAMATLTGQVIQRGGRTRVPAATVRCGDETDAPEAVTGEDGRFLLRVPAGACHIKVFANGFHLFETNEKLSPNELVDVVYYLISKSEGYETVVRGERDKKEVVRRSLDRQELQRVPGSFGDPIRVVQDLPGVARSPYVFGQLIVRGAEPRQTLTYLDGVQIPMLFHLAGGPSVVNGEFLDRLDFYPGGFGARYGRGVGGVVDVTTRKGSADTWHGSVKVDLLDAGFFIEVPIAPGISIAAAARRSYIDTLIPTFVPLVQSLFFSNGTLLVLPRYWDYQVRVDFGAPRKTAPGEARNSYYVMAFGSDDQLRVVASGAGLDRQVAFSLHTLFHRVKGDWTYHQGNLTSTFAPYAGYDLGSFQFGTSTIHTDTYAVGGREDLAIDLTNWWVLRTGFDTLFTHLRGTAQVPILDGTQTVGFPGADPTTQPQTLIRNINAFDGALFLETDFKIGKLTLTPGLRASVARDHGQPLHAFDPRFWARYQLTPDTALKGSVGLYTQPPPATDLEPAPFGNPNLVHEKAFQSSVGAEHKFTDVIHADVTAFYNRRYDNIVSPGPLVINTDGTQSPEAYANLGLGRSYGLEVLVRHEVTKNFFGWLAYTLSRGETRTAGTTANYHPFTYDQTHILTAIASYRLPYGFEVGGRFRYVTGRPTTAILHPYDVYNVDGNNYSGTPGPPLSTRLPGFQQLDIRIDKNFVFQNWTLDLYLDVQNVYNYKNTETVIFDYRLRQEIDVPGIPFLPVVGVQGSF